MDQGVFKLLAEKQRVINRVVNPPAIKMIQNQQRIAAKIASSPAVKIGMRNNYLFQHKFPKIGVANEAIARATRHSAAIHNAISKIGNVNNFPFERMSELQKQADKIHNAINNAQIPNWFGEITFDDLAEVEDEINLPDIEDSSVNLSDSEQITSDDIAGIMNNAFEDISSDSLSVAEKLGMFLKNIQQKLSDNAAILNLLMQFIVLVQGIAAYNHDAEVKQNVQIVINQHTHNYSFHKVFLKEDVEAPIGKMGYLRTDTLLREGAKSTAPVVDIPMVKERTVVDLLDRKGKWLNVQVDFEDESFEGWIQESKVVKFKTKK